VDPAALINLAADFEFYVFGVTFAVCVVILSLGAAVFVVKAVLAHTFPEWRCVVSNLSSSVFASGGGGKRLSSNPPSPSHSLPPPESTSTGGSLH
jgi:hypothetical protein